MPGLAGCFVNEPDDDAYRSVSGSARAGMRFDNGVEMDAHYLRTESESFFDGGFVNESENMQQVLGGSLRASPHAIWRATLLGGRSWDDSDNFRNGVKMSRFDGRRDTLSLQNDFTLAPQHVISLGADYQKDRIYSDTAYPVTSRDNYGVFGQYQAGTGRHNAVFGLRRDDNEQFGGKTTGNAAYGYDLTPALRVSASYGTAYKAPTFNELYFPFFGDPDLDPETARTIEAGISGNHALGKWAVHVFHTRLENLIAFDAARRLAANVDDARIRGLELEAGAVLAGWAAQASLTLLDPENRSNGANRGNVLPRRAEESLRLDTDRDFGRFTAGASMIAAGKRYDDLANRQKLDPYVTFDLRGGYRVTDHWLLQGRAENLLDRDYETAAFFNQPGRSLFITLAYQH